METCFWSAANASSSGLVSRDDLELLVELGKGGLIMFIILAVVSIIYMAATCCLATARAAASRNK